MNTLRQHSSPEMRPSSQTSTTGIAITSFPATQRKSQFQYKEVEEGAIPYALNFTRPIQQSQISNGIKVVSESWDNPVISVGVGIKVGSRDETKETSGTAHFLEHLNFKGTPRKTRLQLERSIENVGAHLNAFTSREFTLYHMLTTQRNLEFAMDMLGDILLNSNYHKHDLENERSTIISELESVGKDDFEVLMENVNFGVNIMK